MDAFLFHPYILQHFTLVDSVVHAVMILHVHAVYIGNVLVSKHEERVCLHSYSEANFADV